MLALGQLDLVAEAQMQPWDWAALVPVIEGAGGRVTDWEGRPLRLGSGLQVLAVGNAGRLPEAISLLAGD
ncbi:inositol monophosphatase family protein [Dankookia sp. GCM10030260]|uniref:inositol monophosphatase family protein n=1 Tax=Dankookia sp. GCM10030260 TaxID=3273390 RepID=UPI003619617B